MIKKLAIAAVCLLSAAVLSASESSREKDIMKTEYARDGVAASFTTDRSWFHFPEYHDREAWNAIFGPTAAHYAAVAEKYLDYQWQHVPATAYLAFERTGNRTTMEAIEARNRGALISLMLGELAEGNGRFLDQIGNGMFFAAEQHNWTLSAHNGVQPNHRSLPTKRFIDLSSGRFGALLALNCHFFRNDIDTLICQCTRAAIKEHILDSYLDPADDRCNHWKGAHEPNHHMNNWTPWCSADALLCALLIEDDEDRLRQAVEMSTVVMDRFLNFISSDGACEEGPSYWNASGGKTYDYLEIMYHASRGAFDVFDNDRLRRYGEYMSRQYVGDGWQTNFADAVAREVPAPVCLWEYGRGFGSRELVNFSYSLLANRTTGRFDYPWPIMGDGYRAVQTLVAVSRMRPAVDSLNAEAASRSLDAVIKDLRSGVPSSTWYPETEQCFLRNSSGWFLGAKGGYNAESHNHNDIGSCILFIDNIPVLVDAGVGTYTKNTFVSAERYKIWTMRGDWHNLPAPNGQIELHGRKYKALDASCDTRKGIFSLEISGAFPEEAAINSYKRQYSLAPTGKRLTITDTFSLKERKAADRLFFMVQGEVEPLSPGLLRISCNDGALKVLMSYPKYMTPTVDTKKIDDPKIGRVWGTELHRITLTSPEDRPVSGKYIVELIKEK